MIYDKSVVVPLPLEETFALVTQPERLRRWNSIAARIDVRVGGTFRWTVTPGMRAMGTVREVDPNARLVLGWGWEGSDIVPPDDSTVTITLEPTDDGTLVRLVHEGLSDEQAIAHGQGWDHYLARLALAGTPSGAGPDSGHHTLDELDELKAAEASLAIVEYVLRQTGPEDHGRTVPSCPEFTVAQLADHLTQSIVGLGGMAGAELAPAPSGNLEVDIADLSAPAIEAWAARGLDGDVSGGGMTIPARMAVGILAVEYLVHAWDFAVATGQTLVVDERLASFVLEGCRGIVGEDMRRPGMFSPAVDVDPDADALVRLIAYTGRQVPVAV